jgi:hypothetical protein
LFTTTKFVLNRGLRNKTSKTKEHDEIIAERDLSVDEYLFYERNRTKTKQGRFFRLFFAMNAIDHKSRKIVDEQLCWKNSQALFLMKMKKCCF